MALLVAAVVLVVMQAIFIPPCLHAVELEDQLYMAGLHESVWAFSGADFNCELRHEVPQFGIARFKRITGENLHFFINSFQPVSDSVEGILREVSPPWKHTPPDPLQQAITIQSGMRPVVLQRKQAGWLLTSLTKGQVVSFSFADLDDSRQRVKVRLSPVNFQKPYREFKRCLGHLSESGGFSELRYLTVHFALDVDTLDNKGERQLDRLAAYILADEDIDRVNIEGHADDQGRKRYNKSLSARRAARVYNYLSRKGIKERLMSKRYYGESRPKIAQRSETARAANRRVEISLYR